MTFGANGYALGEDEGDAIWFFNGLFVVKAAAAETKNAFTLIEVQLPPGGGAPPHIHHDEEEGFYILEGELTVNCGEQSWTATPGMFAFLPRGIPHSFQVSDSGPAKMLQLSSPSQFERFAAEMGEPATAMTLPEPTEVDVPKLLSVTPKYGIEMLPPPSP